MKVESDSLKNPQIVPSDHIYTILQDFGPDGGGWGPACGIIGYGQGGVIPMAPIVYSGRDEKTIEELKKLASMLAEQTGLPTRLAKYMVREDVVSFGEHTLH